MKRIVGMILVVAMVASLVIVSVFAADTREDEMPATCIAEITESGEVIYYVEDEPKENDEATAPATWVADVDEDEEDSPIITRASDLILDENLSDVETSRGKRRRRSGDPSPPRAVARGRAWRRSHPASGFPDSESPH